VKNPLAARRAGKIILQQLFSLKTMPDIGRLTPEFPDLRELVIPFGKSGYIALYRHNPSADRVYVLAFRHQKEAGYGH
jgi:plasmid stabilization system protein ParE